MLLVKIWNQDTFPEPGTEQRDGYQTLGANQKRELAHLPQLSHTAHYKSVTVTA